MILITKRNVNYSIVKEYAGMNIENNRIEYKAQLTDGFEREVVAFLNYHEGGVIYIGIGDVGNIIGAADDNTGDR